MSHIPCIEFPALDLTGIERLAASMVKHLPHHLTIGLLGTLGAGKTTLVQAIARAAGIDSDDVTSPTFTLLQTHHGKPTLHHLDAYRVADEDEFLELGVEELFEEDQTWTLIEWADRVESVMPADTLWIEISLSPDPNARTIRLSTSHPEAGLSLERLARDLGQST